MIDDSSSAIKEFKPMKPICSPSLEPIFDNNMGGLSYSFAS